MFIRGTDVETETPILWPPDAKSWLIWKDPDAGKDWGQEVKGTTEDEMVGWHHRLNGHGFVWTPGIGDRQGGLACCSSWGCRVRYDWVTELNWTNVIPWRRKWQSTPVFLPKKFHGQRSLVSYGPWSLKESDTTIEWLSIHTCIDCYDSHWCISKGSLRSSN